MPYEIAMTVFFGMILGGMWRYCWCLKRRIHAQQEFLSILAHELKTPLNAVTGYAELLHMDGLSQDEMREYLKEQSLAAVVLRKQLDELLEFGRVAAGQVRIAPEFVNIPAFLNEIHSVVKPLLQKKQLMFCLDLPPNGMPSVEVDRNLLRQILLNLLNNSIKYSEDGTISVVCDFLPRSRGRGVLTFLVKDEGCGIAPEQQRRIFEPFYQQKQHAANNRCGVGLGLAIVARIVAAMKGRIEVTSQVGVGSVFHLRFGDIPFRSME